jgi:uncharacterized protein (DUF58 family)
MTTSETYTGSDLLPPEIVRKLQALELGSRFRRAGKLRGDRRSTKRGSSVEFADYRNYTPGDDLRRVDWNLYARTDKLFVKLYEEEEDRAVHLLLDTSASMGFGDPSKLETARRLAAALGYVALHELDRLHVTELGGGGLGSLRPLRGTGGASAMLGFLGGLQSNGEAVLNRSLREYASRAGSPGLLLLISDLMDPNGIRAGLRALGGRGHEITVLHLLSTEELEPTLAGDFELIDAESRGKQAVTLDAAALDAYERRLEAWLAEIGRDCASINATYCLVRAEEDVEDILFSRLRQAKVLVS